MFITGEKFSNFLKLKNSNYLSNKKVLFILFEIKTLASFEVIVFFATLL